MAESLRSSAAASHAVSLDIGKLKPAKATAKKVGIAPEIAPEMALIGSAVQRAVSTVGWSNKEAAAKVGVDAADFGKWISGERRPHFDRLMALDALRWPLICALADLLEVADEIVTLKRRV